MDLPEQIEVSETKEKFLRVLTLPTEEELEKYYKEEYFQEEQGSYKHQYTEEKIESFINKINKRVFVLKNLLISTPENMIDIGSGEGWALRVFNDEGWEVTGLDYITEPCTIYNPEVMDRVIQGNLYDSLMTLIKGDVKYQIVHLDNMLEHVRDPYKLLEYCTEIIKPDGILVIEVPNENSAIHQDLIERKELEYAFYFKYPDHLSYFNIMGLRNICKWAGFKEHYIVDFGEYSYGVRGVKVPLNKYIDRFPIRKSIMYYSLLADLGFGPEILGFWGVNDAVQG